MKPAINSHRVHYVSNKYMLKHNQEFLINILIDVIICNCTNSSEINQVIRGFRKKRSEYT